MHVVFLLLVYWLLSLGVHFLVGTFKKDVSVRIFFCFVVFQQEKAYHIFIATLKYGCYDFVLSVFD